MVFKQVTPAQIREAEKNLQVMESMIEAMTPGYLLCSFLPRHFCCMMVSSTLLS